MGKCILSVGVCGGVSEGTSGFALREDKMLICCAFINWKLINFYLSLMVSAYTLYHDAKNP